MNPYQVTRRSFLKQAGLAGAGIAATPHLFAFQNSVPPAGDKVQQFRAGGATTPIKVTQLRDTLFLLQGVGGNMVAQTGPDGKLLIDASASTAAPHVEEALKQIDAHPLNRLINTHWHYDHTDGNAALHDDAGVFIIAHEQTRKRLSTPQHLAFFQLNFAPYPASALPQQTFAEKQKLSFNHDQLDLVHMPAAHTDTDIYIHFANGNVIHCGDIFFNGFYPFFDTGTGGTARGMIRGAEMCLALADDNTKIVPGHGPLGDKVALQKYRDMLASVTDRIEKLKSSGQTLEQAVAARPTADFDAAWGKGLLTPDQFVGLIYSSV